MKFALLACCFSIDFSVPSFASSCDTDLPALKSQLQRDEIEPDVKAQIEDMVAQAEKFCAAGKDKEAGDVISDATTMLTAQ
ncbi:hypothetical protein [Aestuariivirga sp.]|uniref:hypothetical protein n=1 Tax=Aestuariivirga sp. TaxID=2650926 RepID=UPI003BAB8DC5